MVIVLDVEYNGDAHFEAEIGTSFANVPLGLKNISFNGPLQVELKDLTSKVPFVSAIVMYFIEVWNYFFNSHAVGTYNLK